MHRHAYKSRKLSKAAGPRRALLRGLVDSLILYERIETTEARAREIAPITEKLITKAKKQDLHNYRQILAAVSSPVAGQKLYYELAAGFEGRDGGYTRIIKTGNRRGDNAPMAMVELVLPENFGADKAKAETEKESAKNATRPTTKKVEAKKDDKSIKKPAAKSSTKKVGSK